MPTIRNPGRKRFTTIDNGLIEDDISSEALSVMVYLLNKPDTWVFKSTSIQKRFGWGERKAYRVTKELQAKGYMKFTRSCDGPTIWTVFETVGAAPNSQNDREGEPHSQNDHKEAMTPHGQKPHSQNDRVLVKTKRSVNTKKKPLSRRTRLPESWKLTDKLRKYCNDKRPDLDPDETAEHFINFWIGDGRVKADWDRTFMTWVRNQKQGDFNGNQQNSGTRRESTSDRIGRQVEDAIYDARQEAQGSHGAIVAGDE